MDQLEDLCHKCKLMQCVCLYQCIMAQFLLTNFCWRLRTRSKNSLLLLIGISKNSSKVVYIVCASANVWIVLIHKIWKIVLITKLKWEVIKGSEYLPCIFKTRREHASERVNSFKLENGQIWSKIHDYKLDKKLRIRRDFTK
jgi:hypothetical protein